MRDKKMKSRKDLEVAICRQKSVRDRMLRLNLFLFRNDIWFISTNPASAGTHYLESHKYKEGIL